MIWTSVSLFLLLLIYFIYRRRQNQLDENNKNDEFGGTHFEENFHTREPSEYRLSVVQSLPTIVEENPVTLTPSNSSHNFASTTNTTSQLVSG